MEIRKFPSGPFVTNAYVVACEKTKKCVVIDPSPGSTKYVSGYISRQELTPTHILLTHSHWDHIADVQELKDLYPVPVCIHPLDAPNLVKPGSDGLPTTAEIQSVTPNIELNEGDVIEVGTFSLKVIHTPGHSPGGICFWCENEKILFSGDTLFRSTIGTLSLPTSEKEAMWISLKKLALLPKETKVYPGHGPSTTIGQEAWLSQAEHYFGDML